MGIQKEDDIYPPLPLLRDEEAGKMVNEDEIKQQGLANAVRALQRDLVEDFPEDAVRLLERQAPGEVA